MLKFYYCRMHELGISPEEKRVFFGQLLGMSDPISFTLGKFRTYIVLEMMFRNLGHPRCKNLTPDVSPSIV